MKNSDKSLVSLTSFLREWVDAGMLEPGQMKGIVRALRRLRRGFRSQDMQAVRVAVDELARKFLRHGRR